MGWLKDPVSVKVCMLCGFQHAGYDTSRHGNILIQGRVARGPSGLAALID